MDRIDHHGHLLVFGKGVENGFVIQSVAVPVPADQVLPAGQGIFPDEPGQLIQRSLQVQIVGDELALSGFDDTPGLLGDPVGQDRCGRAGIGSVVLETAILQGVVARSQVDGKGSPALKDRGGKDAGGSLAGIQNPDVVGRQYVHGRQGQQFAAKPVVEPHHAAPLLHLGKVSHPEGLAQGNVFFSLPVQSQNGGSDKGHRTDVEVLAQDAPPA